MPYYSDYNLIFLRAKISPVYLSAYLWVYLELCRRLRKCLLPACPVFSTSRPCLPYSFKLEDNYSLISEKNSSQGFLPIISQLSVTYFNNFMTITIVQSKNKIVEKLHL